MSTKPAPGTAVTVDYEYGSWSGRPRIGTVSGTVAVGSREDEHLYLHVNTGSTHITIKWGQVRRINGRAWAQHGEPIAADTTVTITKGCLEGFVHFLAQYEPTLMVTKVVPTTTTNTSLMHGTFGEELPAFAVTLGTCD